jgi:hypothetical protein
LPTVQFAPSIPLFIPLSLQISSKRYFSIVVKKELYLNLT